MKPAASVSKIACYFSGQCLPPFSGINEALAQKALAEEEDTRLAAGGVALHATSPSLFISLGLELEESQYVFVLLSPGAVTHSTAGVACGCWLRHELRRPQLGWTRTLPSSAMHFAQGSGTGSVFVRCICRASHRSSKTSALPLPMPWTMPVCSPKISSSGCRHHFPETAVILPA